MGRRKKRRNARRHARSVAINAAASRPDDAPPMLAPTLAEMSAGDGRLQPSYDDQTHTDDSPVPRGDLSMGPVIAHLQILTDAAMCAEA